MIETSTVLLVLFGLAAGVGITAVGPGGVLATIGLFAFTGLSPAQVAGTSIVTHIATGALGTAAYTRSGELREPGTRRTALLLAGTAVAGTPVGVLINARVSGELFGVLLGAFAALVAGLVWWRSGGRDAGGAASPGTDSNGAGRPGAEAGGAVRGGVRGGVRPSALATAGIGLGVAAASGVFGVGGPMLTVPLLVALRVPVLSALAAAQAQSVVIAGVGTLGYLAHGAIDWRLAAIVGVPELAGVLAGWAIARSVPAHVLRVALIAVLLALAPYLALHG